MVDLIKRACAVWMLVYPILVLREDMGTGYDIVAVLTMLAFGVGVTYDLWPRRT